MLALTLLVLAAVTQASTASPSAAEVAKMRASLLQQLNDLDTIAVATRQPTAPLTVVVQQPTAPLTVPVVVVPASCINGTRCINGKVTPKDTPTEAQREATVAQSQPGVSSYEHGIRCSNGRAKEAPKEAQTEAPKEAQKEATKIAQSQPGVSSFEHGIRCARGANLYVEMNRAAAVTAPLSEPVASEPVASEPVASELPVTAVVTATAQTSEPVTAVTATAQATSEPVTAVVTATAQATSEPVTAVVTATAQVVEAAEVTITTEFIKAVATSKASARPASKHIEAPAKKQAPPPAKKQAPPPAKKQTEARNERAERLNALRATLAQVRATTTATATTKPHAHTHHQSASYDDGMHAQEMHALWEEEQQEQAQAKLRRQQALPLVRAPDARSKMFTVLCFLGMAATGSAAMVYMNRASNVNVRRNSFSESTLASTMRTFTPTGLMRRRRCSSVQFTGV